MIHTLKRSRRWSNQKSYLFFFSFSKTTLPFFAAAAGKRTCTKSVNFGPLESRLWAEAKLCMLLRCDVRKTRECAATFQALEDDASVTRLSSKCQMKKAIQILRKSCSNRLFGILREWQVKEKEGTWLIITYFQYYSTCMEITSRVTI